MNGHSVGNPLCRLTVIRGTRITGDLIVRMVAQGIPYQEILADYPRLQLADIQAALFDAAAVVAKEASKFRYRQNRIECRIMISC